MIYVRSSSVRLVLCCAAGALLASTASAQRVISTPYSVENGGFIEAIWWDVSGGQEAAPDALRKNRYLSLTPGCGLYENKPIFKWISDNLAGTVTPYSCVVIQSGPRQTTSTDHSIAQRFTNLIPVRYVLPGGDAQMKETRNARIVAVPELIEADPAYAPNPDVNMVARKQKAWLCSNFRIRIGNLPCSRVTQFDPLVFSFSSGGDLDGDGAPDQRVTMGDLGLVVPYDDAPLFFEEFRKAQSGSASSLPLVVEYLDDDGFVLLSISTTVQIRSVGPRDIFANPLTAKEKEVTVTISQSGESKPIQIKPS